MKKCLLCSQEILDEKWIKWRKGKIHLACYTPDKQVDYDVKQYSTNYSSERSPYWEWIEEHGFIEEDIPEPASYSNEEASDLIDELLPTLSNREREVAECIMNGQKEEVISIALKMNRRNIFEYKKRILKKLEKLCAEKGVSPQYIGGL